MANPPPQSKAMLHAQGSVEPSAGNIGKLLNARVKGRIMGSLGKHMKKALAVVLSMALAVTLNPAAAFAGANPTNMTDGSEQNSRPAPEVSDKLSTTGATNPNQLQTEVNVKVYSDFAVTSSDSSFVIDDETEAAKPDKYVWHAQAQKGVPITANGATPHYDYKITRIDSADTSAVPTQVQVYPDTGWASSAETTGTDKIADISYDFSNVKDEYKLKNNQAFTYILTVKDGTGIEKSVRVGVTCAEKYGHGTITEPTDLTNKRGISATGTVYGNKDQSGNFVPSAEINAENPSIPTTNAFKNFLSKLPGEDTYAIDGAFDLSITSHDASSANPPRKPYLSLDSITLPIGNLTEDQINDIKVLGVSESGEVYALARYKGFEIKYADDKYVAVISPANEPFIYAIAYPLDESQHKSSVTTQVLPMPNAEDAKAGGTIDQMGTFEMPTGATTRYTFLPWTGYKLDHVTLSMNGSEAELLNLDGKNFYDFEATDTINTAVITAYFSEVVNPDKPVRRNITATVTDPAKDKDATGNIEIQIPNSEDPDNPTVEITNVEAVPPVKSIKAVVYTGESAVVVFKPVVGSVLDTVKVNGKEQSAPNNTLSLTDLTADISIEANFKYGTPVHYDDVAIAYTPTESECNANNSLGGYVSGQATVPWATAATVNVTAVSGYHLADIYYTVSSAKDSNGELSHLPLRPDGTNSYTIDNVTADIHVYAQFEKDAKQVTLNVGEGGSAAYKYDSTIGEKTGIISATATGEARKVVISDLKTDGTGVSVTVTPSTGKQIKSVSPSVEPTKDEDGSFTYIFPIDKLVDGTISIEFEDVVPITTKVNLSYSTGVTVSRVVDGSASSVSAGVIDNINPDKGLTLKIALAPNTSTEKYSDLHVYVDKSGSSDGGSTEWHPKTGTTDEYFFGKDNLGDNVTIRVTCKIESISTTEITVKATSSEGGSIEPVSKTFASTNDAADISYTIKAKSNEYKLRSISFTNENGAAVGNSVQMSAPGSGIEFDANTLTYIYTLTKDRIQSGVRNVYAAFDYVPATEYNVKVEEVDASGTPVASPIGTILPATSFNKKASGNDVPLTFKPPTGDKTYKVLYRSDISGTFSAWKELPSQSWTLGDITHDVVVQVQFVEDSSAEQPNFYDITVDAAINGEILDAAGTNVAGTTIPVSEHGNLWLTPKAASGYKFSYAVIDDKQDVLLTDLVDGKIAFNNVEAAHTVRVVFVSETTANDLITYYVPQPSIGGTVSPNGNVYVSKTTGIPELITITPDTAGGYRIDSITYEHDGTSEQINLGSDSPIFSTLHI